ncbi:hypothetical protein [Agrobacterium radiobacter]|uniref:hypothetical protein n=1 Tax=Agrobacterium radiobacter TaxID=362 RepID=UPI002782D4A1|nr:hypothetical protein [Agrobacterium tumefaciens]MDP9788745.1 hypothetical protein [Agrobacterium tumefaciens]
MQPHRKPQQPVFRVTFMDGAVVTTPAENSLRAEAKAIKERPGIIRSVRIVRGIRK